MNQPKTGYDLVDGCLVPNADAERVRQVFRLRADGASLREIEETTGIKYSTVSSILKSRIYLGEVLHRGKWYPGTHESLITEEEFRAAQRASIPGRGRGRDLLSGKVRCGLCRKRMPVEQNGTGRVLYRCHHRGKGCRQPSRTNHGLVRAALLALRLLGADERLQEAIRRKLAGGRRSGLSESEGRRQRRPTRADSLQGLSERRRKLLDLWYSDKIPEDLFLEAMADLTRQIEAAKASAAEETETKAAADELSIRFEQVAAILRELDIEVLWTEATDKERRVLVDELLEFVTVFPDHLEVSVAGAPPLNVTYGEVGLKESEIVGVGEGLWNQDISEGCVKT